LDNLLKLLAVLAVAVFAMVVVLERFGKPVTESQQQRLGRWILPLVALLLLVQVLAYYFR